MRKGTERFFFGYSPCFPDGLEIFDVVNRDKPGVEGPASGALHQ